MQRTQLTYLITLSALLLLALGAAAGWALARWLGRIPPTSDFLQLLPLAALLLVALGAGLRLNRFIQAYFFQLDDLNRAAQLMLNVNPAHRITPEGAPPVRDLSLTLNQYAASLDELQTARAVQIARARADLAEERNLLATLMAELSEGVLVCNLDGQILLYNRSVRRLLNQTDDAEAAFVGLGRSIFSLLDRNAVQHGLEQLQFYAARARRPAPAASVDPGSEPHEFDDHGTEPRVVAFLAAMANGRLVRVRMAEFARPTLNGSEYGDVRWALNAGQAYPAELADAAVTAPGGFILTLQDMTQGIEASSRRDFMLQRMTEQLRAGLGAMRAAIETIEAFPEMNEEHRQRFQQVISEEARKLSDELDATMRTHARDLKAQWRLEEMPGRDLLWAIDCHLGQKLNVQSEIAECDPALWLQADSYALVHGLTTVVRQLRDEFDVAAVALGLLPVEPNMRQDAAQENSLIDDPRFVVFELAWPTGEHTAAAWQAWSEQAYVVDDGDATLTLKEVAARHGGEVWFQLESDRAAAYFRLLLPQAGRRPALSAAPAAPRSPAQAGAAPRSPLESRPEYYDFDLFHQPGQKSEVDEQLLTTLTYTVFDTETTGLDPARDEIVSIGAVRIVNGRLLRQEVVDYLIDPGRPIPAVATSVHGISNAMVSGRPTIDVILPRFARFAEDTVLVAHNAAFDMRMLQRQEHAAGALFINPVLDTLLLSTVVHPSENDHSLEAIAARLGVSMLGRHTALGDAMVTAEIFLGLVRLLSEQGIVSLGAARAAAQRSYLARIKY